ncbi:MAG: hypothetical protein IJO97_02265 [Lachnospiraceae bacterium]|nr:hypothetical protein [Lachnospiraceae bacterium]
MKKKSGIYVVPIIAISVIVGGYLLNEKNKEPISIEREEVTKSKTIEEKVDYDEIEEAKIADIEYVTLLGDEYFVLDSCGIVWNWNGERGIKDATPISELKDVSKIVDAGSAIYALTKAGDVYAWGSNELYMIAPEKSNVEVYEKPIKLKGLSNIADIDAGNGSAFAIDNSGRLFMWGLEIYSLRSQDKQPNYIEPKMDTQVEEIFMGAGNFHYFKEIDGNFFSIMKSESDMTGLAYFIFPCFPGEELDSIWWEDMDVMDLRKTPKDGLTFLFEMGENSDVRTINADEYTMYLYKNDNTLWYWKSDRITYHDNETVGALVETAELDYNGSFAEVDLKEVLQINEDSNSSVPNIISICSGKENTFFLLDNGQAFISEYVTREIKDVEYYDAGNTNPYRISETCIEHQMHLKGLSFRKLDYENIVSISSDKDSNFFLVDKWGNIHRYTTEIEKE